jgi:hypothetical protein
MIGKTILHYPAFRDPEQRDKIIATLGEGGMSSLMKNYKRLTPSPGSSFNRKYDKLIPQAGGVVYKAEDMKFKRKMAFQLR